MWLNRSEISSTFKSKYTEEFLDVLFYRPLGYGIAKGSKALGLTPNAVTIFSIFVGVAAGHLFYYRDVLTNIVGVLLLVFAEALDSADGQLARMTNQKSRLGRILDGFSENLWFISIYVHLYFRMLGDGYSPIVFGLILMAGISHSFQSAVADYYRNMFTYFLQGKTKSEMDNSEELATEYQFLSWQKNFGRKFFMRIYMNYTIQQEFISSGAVKLYWFCEERFTNHIPERVSELFRAKNSPLIKYYNILTSNTRMFVLFYAVIANSIPAYLFFEIVCLNLLLVYVVLMHEHNCKLVFLEAQSQNHRSV